MLRWLSQVTTLGLQRNHVYRARWLVQNPFSFALQCGQIPPGPIIQQLLSMPGTGTAFPADLQVFTTEAGLPSDWPADRRNLGGAECTVYTQMRATQDFLLPVGTLEQALAPVNGRLVDFWDETDDIVLVDTQTTTPTPVPPGPSPIPPPVSVPPTTTPPPPPTTQPPAAAKPKPAVIPWAIILIGGASLIIRVLK